MTSPRPTSEDDLQLLAGLAKLLAHPLRLRIVKTLTPGRKMSATELTDEFEDVNLGTCAYHVRTLFNGGALKLADEQQVRGATEHFYELLPDCWLELTDFIDLLATCSSGGTDPQT